MLAVSVLLAGCAVHGTRVPEVLADLRPFELDLDTDRADSALVERLVRVGTVAEAVTAAGIREILESARPTESSILAVRGHCRLAQAAYRLAEAGCEDLRRRPRSCAEAEAGADRLDDAAEHPAAEDLEVLIWSRESGVAEDPDDLENPLLILHGGCVVNRNLAARAEALYAERVATLLHSPCARARAPAR